MISEGKRDIQYPEQRELHGARTTLTEHENLSKCTTLSSGDFEQFLSKKVPRSDEVLKTKRNLCGRRNSAMYKSPAMSAEVSLQKEHVFLYAFLNQYIHCLVLLCVLTVLCQGGHCCIMIIVGDILRVCAPLG